MSTPVEAFSLPAGRQQSRLDEVCRFLVHRQLTRLTHGRLCITDGTGQREFGREDGFVAEVEVNDPRFYRALVVGGSLGAAQAYINGWWDTPDLCAVFRLFVGNPHCADGMDGGLARARVWLSRIGHRWRSNTRRGSRTNITDHYDLGNDFFALVLDPTMTYSCAFYPDEHTGLQDAQRAKLDRICRKLGLQSGHHVLEIGSGWGSFAIHAARNYGCRVTTTTISPSQHDLARQRIAAAGVGDRVELLRKDYRDLTGSYDRIVSIEMVEAVGHRFLPTYFGKIAELMKPGGAALIQAITTPDHRYRQYLRNPDFIQRYVFPGSCCPSLSAMIAAIHTSADLKVTHLEDIGAHYARTLRDWRNNFDANRDRLRELGYSDRLLRVWHYYLCYCEAGYAEGYLGDLQIVLHNRSHRVA